MKKFDNPKARFCIDKFTVDLENCNLIGSVHSNKKRDYKQL